MIVVLRRAFSVYVDSWYEYCRNQPKNETGYPGVTLQPPLGSMSQITGLVDRVNMTERWYKPITPEYGYHFNYLEYLPKIGMGEHSDLPITVPNEKYPDNRACLITAIVGLTDRIEYQGGDLIVKSQPYTKCLLLDRGDVVIFQSHLLHSVVPVRSGVRRTLCGFFCGPREWKKEWNL